MDVWIEDSIYDPYSTFNPQKIEETVVDGKKWYRVWAYLRGADVPLVYKVTYQCPTSLPVPFETVTRNPQNPNCVFSFWTYGIFKLKATIWDINGDSFEIHHNLQFGEQLFKQISSGTTANNESKKEHLV